ncbi:hypothetical protein [Achromobacter xylosoxidans]|uniref:hypothetical protein n=1 Tax=Alcaligenes xylosoxydans xylosoxydans TaxID=85698 RepID=UPI001EED5066|nr:hypothetical protein [Achromobacter xylosoxidans]
MARARNIKPGFFTNEDLVELDFGTRILFAGLWTLADREGRLEDRPKKIKIGVFPADNVDIEVMLQELHRCNFINRYVVNGERYIQIVNWHKHQSPHHTEKASVIPSNDGPVTVKEPKDTGESRNEDGGNPPDSLIPDSLIHKPPPNPPSSGGTTGTLGEKKARVREERMTLRTFLDRCKANGERPIAEYEPLQTYIDESGLPVEFVNICWAEFKRDFLPGGKNERKQQARWRQHFQNFVERNYYKLWFAKQDGKNVAYELTTAGLQAQFAQERREES